MSFVGSNLLGTCYFPAFHQHATENTAAPYELMNSMLFYVFDLSPGQFSCGNKHCEEKEGLKSWEVNFGYVEHGEKKNALVKLSEFT